MAVSYLYNDSGSGTMDEKKMQELLVKVSSGACTVAEALAELKNFPAEMLLCALMLV